MRLKNHKILKTLLKEVDVIKYKSGLTKSAIGLGNKAIVEILFSFGIDFNYRPTFE